MNYLIVSVVEVRGIYKTNLRLLKCFRSRASAFFFRGLRLPERQDWDRLFADYLSALDKEKPVIACGDFNCAHEEIDLAHPENNHFSAGFTDEEREGFSNLLDKGFVDTFRFIHGDVTSVYSWWAQRIKTSKINNSGWRIDYFLVSDRIKDKVKRSEMLDSGPRQDHAPLVLEAEI